MLSAQSFPHVNTPRASTLLVFGRTSGSLPNYIYIVLIVLYHIILYYINITINFEVSSKRKAVEKMLNFGGLSRKSQWEQGNFVCWLEDDLRAELLEAQHREAEAQDALKQSAEFGQVLLSRS